MLNMKKNLAKLVITCMAVGMPITTALPSQADASVLSSVIIAGIHMTAQNEQLRAARC